MVASLWSSRVPTKFAKQNSLTFHWLNSIFPDFSLTFPLLNSIFPDQFPDFSLTKFNFPWLFPDFSLTKFNFPWPIHVLKTTHTGYLWAWNVLEMLAFPIANPYLLVLFQYILWLLYWLIRYKMCVYINNGNNNTKWKKLPFVTKWE